ncbi:MAG: TIGR00282 family metallophosphoesterase, partial [Butyricicoccus sp.]|nr:TIGR00282 family metallophosphoesterase [Butyricicoccus sp.]
MKILAVGDVVFQPGLEILRRKLRAVQKAHGVSFTIVNGENASGVGVTPEQVDRILDAGADLVTLGNHVYGKRQIIPYLDDCPYVLRPANYAPQQPGRGWGIFDCAGWRLLVMNLIGRCDMKFGAENPFLMADRILRQNEGQYDFAVCEIHANATSEKLAMGYYLDGKISALWGTHTHVPTADEQVLPNGTGYQTDLGMTGPAISVLGVKPEQSIALFRGELKSRYEPA